METPIPASRAKSSSDKEKKASLIALSPPPRVGDQIQTPEKPAQFPRRAKNRSVAFSVKEVRQIAIGLRQTDKDSSSHQRSNIAGSTDDLSVVEDQLGVGPDAGAACKASKVKNHVRLPDKYETIAEFFNAMESSIRLLRLKGSMSTFSNICASIQHLTERRFTYGHLAQLKYLLPEAISIKKMLLRDETTSCMKPELQITLQIDSIGDILKQRGENGYSMLRKVFRERLVDFSNEHPQEDDVPEEMLPYPFCQTRPSLLPIIRTGAANSTSVELPSSRATPQQFVVPSHMPPSFQRRFTRKNSIPDVEKTALTCMAEASPDTYPLLSPVASPIKCTPKPPPSKRSFVGSSSPLSSLSTPGNSKEPYLSNGTPAKVNSTPRLMSATPNIETPKRYRPTMAYDTPPPKNTERRSTRTKLFPTPRKFGKAENEENEENEESEAASPSAADDVINFLPKALLQSIKEKEKRALQERQTGAGKAKRRQKMIAFLPNIFDMIHLIFQSGSRSLMTKQELMHKIISSNCKIVDRSEVEEQLKLILEILPDWISEKMASTGDSLLCVNKISNAEELRQRLAEAE